MSRKAWGFFFFIFLFYTHCFAYDIKPYSKQVPDKSRPVLNLVFCPLNYANKKDLFTDIDALTKKLIQTKPFDEFKDLISIWRISFSKDEEKKLFQENSGIPPLRVRKDFLDHILSYLKSDYKLIIIDAKGSLSCAELSSREKMSLIILGKNRYKDKHSFAKGFLHELGHSLGLQDECVDCSQLSSGGPPNCAATKEEAERLWGDLVVGEDLRVNYISGCSGNKSYIRPTIASLMNDPDKAEDFGPVNERYLRREFFKN